MKKDFEWLTGKEQIPKTDTEVMKRLYLKKKEYTQEFLNLIGDAIIPFVMLIFYVFFLNAFTEQLALKDTLISTVKMLTLAIMLLPLFCLMIKPFLDWSNKEYKEMNEIEKEIKLYEKMLGGN